MATASGKHPSRGASVRTNLDLICSTAKAKKPCLDGRVKNRRGRASLTPVLLDRSLFGTQLPASSFGPDVGPLRVVGSLGRGRNVLLFLTSASLELGEVLLESAYVQTSRADAAQNNHHTYPPAPGNPQARGCGLRSPLGEAAVGKQGSPDEIKSR